MMKAEDVEKELELFFSSMIYLEDKTSIIDTVTPLDGYS